MTAAMFPRGLEKAGATVVANASVVRDVLLISATIVLVVHTDSGKLLPQRWGSECDKTKSASVRDALKI